MSYYEHHKTFHSQNLGFHALIIARDAIVVYLITEKYAVTLVVLYFYQLGRGVLLPPRARLERVHWGKAHWRLRYKKQLTLRLTINRSRFALIVNC